MINGSENYVFESRHRRVMTNDASVVVVAVMKKKKVNCPYQDNIGAGVVVDDVGDDVVSMIDSLSFHYHRYPRDFHHLYTAAMCGDDDVMTNNPVPRDDSTDYEMEVVVVADHHRTATAVPL